MQGLISTCGPRLRWLSVSMPFTSDARMVISSEYTSFPTTTIVHTSSSPHVAEHSIEILTRLDLSPCSMLQTLILILQQESATDEQPLDMLKGLLSSWDADVPQQDVYLFSEHKRFTRRAYTGVLLKMGQVLEGWLGGSLSPSRAGGEVSEQHPKRQVGVVLRDREVWKVWWRAHIRKCFPTFAKSKRLKIAYLPRECCRNIVLNHISHFICCAPVANDDMCKWQDSKALPPVLAAGA